MTKVEYIRVSHREANRRTWVWLDGVRQEPGIGVALAGGSVDYLRCGLGGELASFRGAAEKRRQQYLSKSGFEPHPKDINPKLSDRQISVMPYINTITCLSYPEFRLNEKKHKKILDGIEAVIRAK